MRRVTVDLSPSMNLEVTVNRREHAPTKRGQAVVAGSIEIRHPSYREKFVLQCSGADQQHTWLRADVGEKASKTECLLLWGIFNS